MPASRPLRAPSRAAWTWLVHVAWALAFGACLTAPAAARKKSQPVVLANPLLSPALAQFLVGPAARMATPEEIAAFRALADDAAAEAWIEAFWAARDPDPERPGNPVREIFEARAAEADRRFSEAAYLGRRTDRGTIWVLYGPPEEVEFEPHPRRDGNIEVWVYPKEREAGLDGAEAERWYRFFREEDLTSLYRGRGAGKPPAVFRKPS